MKEWLNAMVKWLLAPEMAWARFPRDSSGPIGSILQERPAVEATEAVSNPLTHLWPRWIVLRALGLIYFSAFYALLFQIKGLIGPNGILPASEYLRAVATALHGERIWFAPTLLWFGSSDRALMLVCWVGLVASVLVFLNIWPRAALAICFVCFLSFVSTAEDFSGYQSDGMLLEAGFISLFFAPAGFLPGLGRTSSPSRASLFLLQWEWFRIYFESGVVKIASGDQSWRHFTAMDDYYQNGPLPTWIGWYVQHLPHWFHAFITFVTLAMEITIVWMLFLPRRFRIACFWIVTPFQIAIILTANYAFLNYIVLALGFLLLDDSHIEWLVPERIRNLIDRRPGVVDGAPSEDWRGRWRKRVAPVGLAVAGICLGVMFYASAMQLLWMFLPEIPLLRGPITMLEPFRVADRYGLFAVMTHARYEIEFQGSRDGKTWVTYPFRYKPQDIRKAPGIYAPYQPRFEWNLWFASLGRWPDYRWVVWTEIRLLQNRREVLELFAQDPFGGSPPQRVRSVIYQYWFTDFATKRQQGTWWRRERLGEYAPVVGRQPDGSVEEFETPSEDLPPPQ